VFHQMEGVRVFTEAEWTAAGASDGVAHAATELKSTLEGLARHLFGPVEVRWVDAYFPFTEPSYEMEIFFNGQWLEVLGCGVMQQSILDGAGGTGKRAWAFGLGLERLAMVLFGIPDIRLFWSNDERFTKQFKAGGFKAGGAGAKFSSFSKYPPCLKDVSFWLPNNVRAAGAAVLVWTVCCAGADAQARALATLAAVCVRRMRSRRTTCARLCAAWRATWPRRRVACLALLRSSLRLRAHTRANPELTRLFSYIYAAISGQAGGRVPEQEDGQDVALLPCGVPLHGAQPHGRGDQRPAEHGARADGGQAAGGAAVSGCARGCWGATGHACARGAARAHRLAIRDEVACTGLCVAAGCARDAGGVPLVCAGGVPAQTHSGGRKRMRPHEIQTATRTPFACPHRSHAALSLSPSSLQPAALS
jgi:hypothetical protein